VRSATATCGFGSVGPETGCGRNLFCRSASDYSATGEGHCGAAECGSELPDVTSPARFGRRFGHYAGDAYGIMPIGVFYGD